MFEIETEAVAPDHVGQSVIEHCDPQTAETLQKLLNRLASEQENAAASEAAQVPYWKACPDSVRGSRAAARALRALAESLSGPSPQVGS